MSMCVWVQDGPVSLRVPNCDGPSAPHGTSWCVAHVSSCSNRGDCGDACTHRHFRSKETETRIVASLVEKAMAGTGALAPAPVANLAHHSKAQRRKGGAPAPAPGSQASGVSQSTGADAKAAREALMAVMGEAEGCAQLALALLLQKVRAPAKEVRPQKSHPGEAASLLQSADLCLKQVQPLYPIDALPSQ